MNRGVGEFAVVESLPEWIVLLAVVVTQLGDVWFVLLLVGTLYWFDDALPGALSFERTRGAFGLALAIGGLAVTTALKGWIAFDRPPGAADPRTLEFLPTLLQSAYAAGASASGFAFPSGHAVAVVVVYGGLALLAGSRRASALAIAIVVTVSLTRVVLQVHYLVDVVAGLAVGATYLVVVYRGSGRGHDPARAFSVAVGFGVVGVLLGGYTADTMAALGGTLGARIAWGCLDNAVVESATTWVGGVVAAAAGLAFLTLGVPLWTTPTEPYLVFLWTAVVLAGVVTAPLAGEKVARRFDRERKTGM